MTDYLTNDTDLAAVADAIRAKGGTASALTWPTGYVDAIGAISGGAETAHITVDLSMGGQAYYTDANGTVKTEVVDYDTGTVGVDDDAILGSLLVLYALMAPVGPTGATLVSTLSSGMGNMIVVYEVTG